MNRTIAGICTPAGHSGIGIVRISGPEALEVAKKMSTGGEVLLPRQVVFGTVYGENFSDKAVIIYFSAPHSFTGEDTVEFQCHGGPYLMGKVLETALTNGAVPATNGEFSRQAFLNGKISLDQAEAIIDIINAESDAALRCSTNAFRGQLRNLLDSFEDELVTITAEIEVTLDYPEHDIEHATIEGIKPKLQDIYDRIGRLIMTNKSGKLIANGIRVAVLGQPNVGKSSLFNALLAADRSIITEIAGTTTDTITESIIYKDMKITFTDTAGLRDGRNQIEKLGVGRSKQAAEDCDIALIVFDSSTPPDAKDTQTLELTKEKPHVVVLNKYDLEKGKKNLKDWIRFIKANAEPDIQHSEMPLFITASALTGEHIDTIKQEIYAKIITMPLDTDSVVITNTRHINELKQAAVCLQTAIHAVDTEPLDCIATDIKDALTHIGNITGTHASEAVLDKIFSRFCLGK